MYTTRLLLCRVPFNHHVIQQSELVARAAQSRTQRHGAPAPIHSSQERFGSTLDQFETVPSAISHIDQHWWGNRVGVRGTPPRGYPLMGLQCLLNEKPVKRGVTETTITSQLMTALLKPPQVSSVRRMKSWALSHRLPPIRWPARAKGSGAFWLTAAWGRSQNLPHKLWQNSQKESTNPTLILYITSIIFICPVNKDK